MSQVRIQIFGIMSEITDSSDFHCPQFLSLPRSHLTRARSSTTRRPPPARGRGGGVEISARREDDRATGGNYPTDDDSRRSEIIVVFRPFRRMTRILEKFGANFPL